MISSLSLLPLRKTLRYHQGSFSPLGGLVNREELSELEAKLESLRAEPAGDELVRVLNDLAYNGLYYLPSEKAEAYASEARNLAERLGLDEALAQSLLTLGVIKLDTGNYPDAMAFCRSSLKLSERIGNPKGIASAQGTIGNIFWNMGSVEKALEQYIASLHTKQGYGASPDVLAHSYYNIGSCYLSQKELDRAESAFEFVRGVWEASGDRAKIAFIYNNIGAVHKERNELVKAMDCLGRALEIRLETGQKKNAAGTLGLIGDLQKQAGNLESALDFYSKSIALSDDTDYKRGSAYALCRRGGVLVLLGKHSEAEESILRSMEICESIGLSKMTIDCLEEMMNLHEARGELGKALAVARELKAKQEEHLNRENLQRIAELQVQYETERKEQESEIYRLKNVELEKKNEELSQALEHVRRLQGMLPICSHCKKIRDDSGYWEQIESYISKHSETEFSHSICPECLKELYGSGDMP